MQRAYGIVFGSMTGFFFGHLLFIWLSRGGPCGIYLPSGHADVLGLLLTLLLTLFFIILFGIVGNAHHKSRSVRIAFGITGTLGLFDILSILLCSRL